MTSEWDQQRQELQAEAKQAIEALIEHMGALDSFQFALDDGRMVTVKVSTKSD